MENDWTQGRNYLEDNDDDYVDDDAEGEGEFSWFFFLPPLSIRFWAVSSSSCTTYKRYQNIRGKTERDKIGGRRQKKILIEHTDPTTATQPSHHSNTSEESCKSKLSTKKIYCKPLLSNKKDIEKHMTYRETEKREKSSYLLLKEDQILWTNGLSDLDRTPF